MLNDPKVFHQARVILGISAQAVADAAGIKQSSVADIEACRKQFKGELAEAVWAGLWRVVDECSARNRDAMEASLPSTIEAVRQIQSYFQELHSVPVTREASPDLWV